MLLDFHEDKRRSIQAKRAMQNKIKEIAPLNQRRKEDIRVYNDFQRSR